MCEKKNEGCLLSGLNSRKREQSENCFFLWEYQKALTSVLGALSVRQSIFSVFGWRPASAWNFTSASLSSSSSSSVGLILKGWEEIDKLGAHLWLENCSFDDLAHVRESLGNVETNIRNRVFWKISDSRNQVFLNSFLCTKDLWTKSEDESHFW